MDQEFLEASLDFIERANVAGEPFFVWHNPSRMHFYTPIEDEQLGTTGLNFYADAMVEHEGHVGELLDKLDESAPISAAPRTSAIRGKCTQVTGAVAEMQPDNESDDSKAGRFSRQRCASRACDPFKDAIDIRKPQPEQFIRDWGGPRSERQR